MNRGTAKRRTWIHAAAVLWLMAAFSGCQITKPAGGRGALRPQWSGRGEIFETAPGGLQIRRSTPSWSTRQRENIVMQRYDYSCGSAALATVLRYYFQDDIDESKVLIAIFLSLKYSDLKSWSERSPSEIEAAWEERKREGFSMGDLVNAVKVLNKARNAEIYSAAVVRRPLEVLAKLPAPAIVRIEKYGYKHFVVVRGIRDGTVYLADPVRGNLRLSVQEFQAQWSGEFLVLGKTGFGLPADYPLAVRVEGSSRPELDVARQVLFPPR